MPETANPSAVALYAIELGALTVKSAAASAGKPVATTSETAASVVKVRLKGTSDYAQNDATICLKLRLHLNIRRIFRPV